MKVTGNDIRQIHNNQFIEGLKEIEDPEFKIFVSDIVIETKDIIDEYIEKQEEINSDKEYQKYQSRLQIMMKGIKLEKGGYKAESVSSELSKLESDFADAINRHQAKWKPHMEEWKKKIDINIEPFEKSKLPESLTIEQRIMLAPFLGK